MSYIIVLHERDSPSFTTLMWQEASGWEKLLNQLMRFVPLIQQSVRALGCCVSSWIVFCIKQKDSLTVGTAEIQTQSRGIGKTAGRISWITSSLAHQKVFTHLTNDMNNKSSLFTIVGAWRRSGLREPIRETNVGHADVIQQETDVSSRRPVSMTVTESDKHGALISSLI